ncbi:hypothetical protein ACFWUP_03395 [Nocardia sp. NPDC058658]|uniref:hypothetical protein n=1 Tax=Nocardia sp. NPDC058658 TaxID=3346580 RepID=UPI00366093EF
MARVVLLGLLVSAGVIACAVTTDSRSPDGNPTGVDAPVIDAAAAAQLCETMRAEIDNWRQQGSAIARVKFNGVVHTWALRNGAINIALARHRETIDVVTRENCPNAREQVKQIIDTGSLASGLVGF